jgi:hypothetical protein
MLKIHQIDLIVRDAAGRFGGVAVEQKTCSRDDVLLDPEMKRLEIFLRQCRPHGERRLAAGPVNRMPIDVHRRDACFNVVRVAIGFDEKAAIGKTIWRLPRDPEFIKPWVYQSMFFMSTEKSSARSSSESPAESPPRCAG